jgi:hypothetical protein
MPRKQKELQYYIDKFNEYNCKVLDTLEDYNKYIILQKYKKFNIQYKCGHVISNCYYHTFMSRKSNTTCKLCNTS